MHIATLTVLHQYNIAKARPKDALHRSSYNYMYVWYVRTARIQAMFHKLRVCDVSSKYAGFGNYT